MDSEKGNEFAINAESEELPQITAHRTAIDRNIRLLMDSPFRYHWINFGTGHALTLLIVVCIQYSAKTNVLSAQSIGNI